MANEKVFSDPIYGQFGIDATCCLFVDTPEFQRLRDIKQLGGTAFVYQSANHTRFEHSLGVCHLASRWLDILQAAQPDLNITDQERLCVQLAGLCHDLGHGPFSHMFDAHFIKDSLPLGEKWNHENASNDMIDHIVKTHNLAPALQERGLSVPEDIDFIKTLIAGQPRIPGRKEFLYDIVANKRNNIDCDKFDYFQRDTLHLGLKMPFSADRLMHCSRVVTVPYPTSNGNESSGGTNQQSQQVIAFQEKEAYSVYELFQTRYALHKKAYQHRVGQVVDLMHCEALKLADPYLTIPSGDGIGTVRLSESIRDMSAYRFVTDAVFSLIAVHPDPRLAPAKAILDDVKARRLYAFVGETLVQPHHNIGENVSPVAGNKRNASQMTMAQWKPGLPGLDDIKSAVLTLCNDSLATASRSNNEENLTVTCDDIFLETATINYGCKAKNPVDRVHFYSRKAGLDAPFQMHPSQIGICLPSTFEEKWIRLFCRHPENVDMCSRLRKAWEKWCMSCVGKVSVSTPVKFSDGRPPPIPRTAVRKKLKM